VAADVVLASKRHGGRPLSGELRQELLDGPTLLRGQFREEVDKDGHGLGIIAFRQRQRGTQANGLRRIA
jgi:hypothetical protein